jgi:hypothetical protein
MEKNAAELDINQKRELDAVKLEVYGRDETPEEASAMFEEDKKKLVAILDKRVRELTDDNGINGVVNATGIALLEQLKEAQTISHRKERRRKKKEIKRAIDINNGNIPKYQGTTLYNRGDIEISKDKK